MIENEQQDSEHVTSMRNEGWEDTYNTLLLRLDPSSTLMKLKYNLLRHKYDYKTNSYKKIPGLKPKMAEQGVEDLLLELDSRMSVDKVLSNLTESKVNEITRHVGEVILSFLFFHADEYEIERSDCRSITWVIVDNINVFLRRALHGTENQLISKSMMFAEVTQRKAGSESASFENHPKKSGLSFLKSRGRR